MSATKPQCWSVSAASAACRSSSCKPNPRNPRRNFADAELDELAASIRERGIIQPILVRAMRGAMDQYEIVAGERRWRAAQRAGLHDVPVLLLEVSDREALELAIIENVQRTDLNALEEAGGYQSLMDEFDHSQEDVSKIVGKSRRHVANTLRLLKLSERVKAYINSGQLSAGHARLLVGQPNAEEFAEEIVSRGLNVRQVEAWARRDGKKQVRELRRTGRIGPDPDVAALEKRLTDVLGLTVRILHRVDGEGIISIRYRSLEQLDEVIAAAGERREVVAVGPAARLGATAILHAGLGLRHGRNKRDDLLIGVQWIRSYESGPATVPPACPPRSAAARDARWSRRGRTLSRASSDVCASIDITRREALRRPGACSALVEQRLGGGNEFADCGRLIDRQPTDAPLVDCRVDSTCSCATWRNAAEL